MFEDVSDVWADNGLDEAFSSSAASMTMDDKKWGVPYTYYQWGIYYRKDIFADLGIEPPADWESFLAACATIKESGVTPIAIGTKALWPTGGWFDYLNLRVNGYEFHMELTGGGVPYTDDRVKAVFEKWGELVNAGYFVENHAALDWQDALPLVAQGEAAMYLIGNFAVAPLRDAGLTDDQLGFMQFPAITPISRWPRTHRPTPSISRQMPRTRRMPRSSWPTLRKPEVQTKINATLGQLPVNSQSEVPEDPFLSAGFEMLSNAHALAQFYDRDAVAEMAKAGMEGFQEFMVKPDRGEKILERLEKIRSRVHK